MEQPQEQETPNNAVAEKEIEQETTDDNQVALLDADATEETDALLSDEDNVITIEELPEISSPTSQRSGSLIGMIITPSANSLAWAPSTPVIARWLIPLLCLLTHAAFLYGQIEPMWRLAQTQSVDAWWNATTLKSRMAFDAMGVPHNLHLVRDEGSTIQTFTYSFAIQELWEAKGMPGTTLPRIASVLLALFSGVWPHMKLLLLNWTWLYMGNAKRRTGVLHWLSCLGKWSLADILVVCVMVGVLHIDWNVDPEAIRVGIADNLEMMIQLVHTQYSSKELCSTLLHHDCDHPSGVKARAKCDTCIQLAVTAFDHDDWAGGTGRAILDGIKTSGDGVCSLRVIGMRGIYAFCGAVVVSILLSLVVDVLDHRAQEDELRLQTPVNHQSEEQALLLDEEAGDEHEAAAPYTLMEDNNAVDEPMLEGAIRSHLNVETASHIDNDTVAIPIRWFSCTHGLFSFLVLITAIFAVSWVTLEREVHGAIPKLLSEILGMAWGKSYSLQSLSATTGAAGGWDLMLMSTFSLFIVVGPLLRASLCVLGHILPGRLSTIQTFVDLVGAFCAWEVMVIAVAMISLLMPSITGTILMDKRCAQVDDSGSCFEVEFNVVKPFILVLVSGTLLVLISNTFSCFARKPPPTTTRR